MSYWEPLLFKYYYYCIYFYYYCISLAHRPLVSNVLPLTSSLGEFPGYWDWLRYPGLPSVLVSIAFSPFTFQISVFFYSLFACHWISFVFLLYDQHFCTHSIDPSLAEVEFPGLGLARCCSPRGRAWSRNLISNFCPGRGLNLGPQSNGRERYH